MSIRTLALSSCLLAACLDEPALDETTQAVVEANGVSLNGVSLNGVSLNGVSLNGVSLNGVSLNGVSLNGVSLNGVSLNGVSLNGVSLNGSSLTGVRSDTGTSLTVDAVGTIMRGILSNGSLIRLRIDSATMLADTNADVWTYGVSYASDLGFQPLCGDSSISALAISGTWNTQSGVTGGGAYAPSTTTFTFACRGRSIAKCVELGYKPWQNRTNELASCVRLLRGDYCGNGTPYTTSGLAVNLSDNVDVQADTESWVAEAEWTPNGARCVSTTYATRFYESGFTLPCMTRRYSTTGCAQQGFPTGVYLISEVPPETLSSEPFQVIPIN